MEKNNKTIQSIKQRYQIVGKSEGLLRALEIALMVAPRDLSVLIIGESGVGKEVIPRVIHDNSVRKHNKYFAINCGSIPEGTIDSELFGHAKGAFTGAIGEREGYFGSANGGTLFLDEVGELPLATQARLLRVLETGEYIRVGESIPRKTDVRIVAATNVNIEKAIREGKFRADLYYRLNTIPITLPPLRERGDDITLLFKKFAIDIAEKYHCEPIRLTEEANDLLLKYSWPGNIRQLRNVTEQLSAMFYEENITRDMLEQFGITDDSDKGGGIVVTGPAIGGGSGDDNSNSLYARERDQIFNMCKTLAEEIAKLKLAIFQNQQSQESQFSLPQAPSVMQKYDEPEELITEIETAAPVTIRDTTLQKILASLAKHNNNRRLAAEELGISERTLYRKIKDFNLEDKVKKTKRHQ